MSNRDPILDRLERIGGLARIKAESEAGCPIASSVVSRLCDITERLLAQRAAAGELPADVVRLVCAARKVAFEDYDDSDIRELDQASEAFADRVPWEDDPEAEGT